MSQLRNLARRLIYPAPIARFSYGLVERLKGMTLEKAPARDEDGAPIPPNHLIVRVSGRVSWRQFLASGRAALGEFAAAIDRNGGDFRKASRVLDFGCGCGRLARHARAFTSARIFGVDYNASLALWCAKNLDGEFTQNRLTPPLEFPDAHFDALYALSVFTHLRPATQDEWLSEFARVVKPGGFALITFHDEHHPNLAGAGVARATLLRDGFVIANDKAEGSNLIGTFQTQAAARAQFSRAFEIAEFIPCNETSIGQTIAVLRRR